MSAGNKILKDIVAELESVLNKCGVMYHIFYRAKSASSIKNKLDKKSKEYKEKSKKMQDLLALRITLYFTDDVNLIHNYLKISQTLIVNLLMNPRSINSVPKD